MRILILAGFLAWLSSCTKKPAAPPNPVEDGRRLYATHCTACHSPDPKKDGAIGPAIYGSTKELLERKLVHGDYPASYTPKRTTKMMTLLPFLKDEIPNLHAYLNNP